ncbi:MAG TPA: hypothetical protein VIL38_04145, partial [Thermaerobacter sp.]
MAGSSAVPKPLTESPRRPERAAPSQLAGAAAPGVPATKPEEPAQRQPAQQHAGPAGGNEPGRPAETGGPAACHGAADGRARAGAAEPGFWARHHLAIL